ncbi:hypothetical protein AEB_P2612 [Altererythrobacter sp. B11]|nr:hypothetical protein AEB_P2612 [Altererythrobacter sp. B11]
MLVVETVVRIRREHASGKAIKAIARDLRLSRKVVRKAIRAPEGAFDYRRTVQPLPRLGPFQERLDTLLTENEARHRRDRLRMTRIHDLLCREGFEGSYDAVRRYAQRWREARRKDAGDGAPAFIPLMFKPGEAYQFDWSHEDVEIAGKPMRVKVAHMRLCASRAVYVRAYPRETQEMVFDAHARGFAFFGGVPLRGIYDNMKTAVTAVFAGKERVFNRRFLVMADHYMVEPTACSPAAGWEKGQVENQVQTIRGRFFQCRAAPHAGGQAKCSGPQGGARPAGGARCRAPRSGHAFAVVGRRAAAGFHCTGIGQPTAGNTRRRADCAARQRSRTGCG